MYIFKRIFLFAFIAMSFLQSCKVLLVPPKNAGVITDIVELSKSIDGLYLNIKNTEVEDRTYPTFSGDYIFIKTQANSILLQERTREKAGPLIKMVENIISLIDKYSNDHQVKNTLNDAKATLNNKYLQDAIAPLLTAEKSLK
jgi:hypothetical protein